METAVTPMGKEILAQWISNHPWISSDCHWSLGYKFKTSMWCFSVAVWSLKSLKSSILATGTASVEKNLVELPFKVPTLHETIVRIWYPLSSAAAILSCPWVIHMCFYFPPLHVAPTIQRSPGTLRYFYQPKQNSQEVEASDEGHNCSTLILFFSLAQPACLGYLPNCGRWSEWQFALFVCLALEAGSKNRFQQWGPHP